MRQHAPEPNAYSILDFCRTHGISKAFFYELQKEALGPRVMKVGRRVLISRQAAEDWVREREAAALKEARTRSGHRS